MFLVLNSKDSLSVISGSGRYWELMADGMKVSPKTCMMHLISKSQFLNGVSVAAFTNVSTVPSLFFNHNLTCGDLFFNFE